MAPPRTITALTTIALTGAAVVAFAALPQQTGNVDLLTQANIRIDGAAGGDIAGSAVAPAGDVNGDGRQDILIGAQFVDNNGRNGSGSVYVVYGSPTLTNVDLATLGAPNTRGFRVDGAATLDEAGASVAAAGDVNGDGRDDVLIGANRADNNGRTDSGSAYVVYGSAAPTNLDLADLAAPSTRGFRIDGAATLDEAGFSVAAAGDVNGDGRQDILIGAYQADNNGRGNSGSGYVVYGSATPANLDLAALGTSGFRIDGAAAGDQAGFSVDGAGDVNGDGRQDILIGAIGTDNNGRNFSGSAYVVYGSAAPTNLDLATLAAAGPRGFHIDGAAAGDVAGASVDGAGDVNGDGRDDVLIGAAVSDNNGRVDSGSGYVVYGSPTPANLDLATLGAPSTRGFRIDGAAAGDRAGASVAEAGDVNGDGRDDVLIGAYQADNNGRSDSGSGYVVYGSPTPANLDLATLGAPSTRGFRIDGAAAGDQAGASVAEAGDVNGDGRQDILIGANGADNNARTESGSVYVVYGFGAPSVTYPAITATTGQPITPTTPVVRRTGDAAFTATGLPTGLVVDPATGTLTGTPTTTGTAAATVVMTDLAGTTQATLTITVTSPPQPPAAAPVPLRRLTVTRPLPVLRLSRGTYRFQATCSETCTLRASMRVGVRGGTRFVALPTPQRRGLRLGSGTATTTTQFTFPTRKARAGALTGLTAGRKVVAKVTVVATFPDGQRRSITRFTTVAR